MDTLKHIDMYIYRSSRGHTQTHGCTHTHVCVFARTYTTTVFHGVIFPQPTARLPLAPDSAPCLSFKLEQVIKHSVSVPSDVERSNPKALGFAP